MLKNLISRTLKTELIRCSAVVVAAGSSVRFGSDKIMTELMGIPILAYSLLTLQSSDYIHEIIVVTDSAKITACAQLCADYKLHKVTKILCGGATRLESSLSGVSETSPDANLIAIHDGARPLVTREIVDAAIQRAFTHRAAIAAIPANDTVKILDGTAVSSTPQRSNICCAQTPQVFEPVMVKGALTNALQKGLPVTDDASAVEALGFTVYVTPGSEENIKITRPMDIKLAELILQERKNRYAKSSAGEVSE